MSLNEINGYMSILVSAVPIIIPIAAIFSSVLDASAKGFIFILGIFLTVFITVGISKLTKGQKNNPVKSICNIFGEKKAADGLLTLKVPDISVLILTFTLFYVCICPLAKNGNADASKIMYTLLPTLLFLVITSVYRYTPLCCSNEWEIFLGFFIGGLTGGLWWWYIGGVTEWKKDLTYFEKDSNKRCVRFDSGTVFKCNKKTTATLQG